MPCSSFKFMFSVKISKTKSISQPLALSACIWCRIVSIRFSSVTFIYVQSFNNFLPRSFVGDDAPLTTRWTIHAWQQHLMLSETLFRSIHLLILIRDNEWWHCWDISAPSGEEKDSVMENLIFPYIQLDSSPVCMHPHVNTSLPPRCWHFVVFSWETMIILILISSEYADLIFVRWWKWHYISS